MIRGQVTRFKARICLEVRGGGENRLTIEAAVDTGFNGMVALPLDIINALELPWKSEGSGILADGRVSYFNLCTAKVLWHGRLREVTVSALEMYPVIGMGLLDGSELNIKVRAGGKVTIKPLRRQ
jgi:clan AA aspartic protease